MPWRPGGESKSIRDFKVVQDRRPAGRPANVGDVFQKRIGQPFGVRLKVPEAERRLGPEIETERADTAFEGRLQERLVERHVGGPGRGRGRKQAADGHDIYYGNTITGRQNAPV